MTHVAVRAAAARSTACAVAFATRFATPFVTASAIALAAALALCAALPARAQAPNLCGELKNHYGPFDYRKDRGDKLDIVERAHFTHAIESLQGGVNTTRANVAGDITYTLHTFPNHHRALLALERLGAERKTDLPPSSRYTVECYYNRALRFAPDDTVVRILYARYLGKQKRKADAVVQLQMAAEQADDDGFTHYNIGLMYFELGDFDQALAHAHTAHALGFDRPELADMLKRENKWQEPPPGNKDEPSQANPAVPAGTNPRTGRAGRARPRRRA